VPGRGHASPIVWGDKVFLSSADETSQRQMLLCFDQVTGSQRWQCELGQGHFGTKHDRNSFASATPACDGRYVFYPFAADGALWVVAVDFHGNIVWKTKAGPYLMGMGHGYASSPTLVDGLIVVLADNFPGASRRDRLRAALGLKHEGYLAALDCSTGAIVWRIRRPARDTTSYGSPVVTNIDGTSQIVVPGGGAITAYNPSDGSELWYCRWEASRGANSVAIGNRVVIASASDPSRDIYCIRADGSGDVTDTHIAWHLKHRGSEVPTPLVYGNYVVWIEDNGVASCVESTSGKSLWKHRLGGNFSASPIVAGGNIIAINEAGRAFVFKPASKFQLVAENDLNEETMATPSPSGNNLLVRTSERLWCLAEQR
jgi:outer membrane protein assembly factor BamB